MAPGRRRCTREGLFCGNPNGEGGGATFLSEPFEVVAEARDPNGDGWGLWVRLRDRDGREKREFVAQTWGGAEMRAVLAYAGLVMGGTRGSLDKFSTALARVTVPVRITLSDGTGWCGDTFVLPHRAIGPAGREEVMFTGERRGLYYGEAGSFVAWQEEVAALAVGNSLLAFVLSFGFAGPLLRFLGVEGGGFHLRGPTSIGKTTLTLAAGSIWGGAGDHLRSRP